MAFKTEYHGLKAMLGEVIGSSQKKTISTLNVSFDDSTGKLTGEMLVVHISCMDLISHMRHHTYLQYHMVQIICLVQQTN